MWEGSQVDHGDGAVEEGGDGSASAAAREIGGGGGGEGGGEGGGGGGGDTSPAARSRLEEWRRGKGMMGQWISGSVVVCPATWGRGDDPVEGRKYGEGEIYPEEWVRLSNHFVGT